MLHAQLTCLRCKDKAYMNTNGKDSPIFDFYATKKNSNELIENNTKAIEHYQKTSNKLQILVLETDEKSACTLTAILKFKYDVYCVADPATALDILAKHKIALIISDQALPLLSIDGAEFLLKAKVISPNTSRILIAGQLDFAKAKSSLKKGDVFRVIKKPWDNNRFIELIEQAIELFLENSGGFANAAAQLQKNAPNIDKEVKITPSIPASANVVIIKSEDPALFEEIKQSYSETAHFIHAEDKDAVINILETTLSKTLVYSFEQKNTLEQPEAEFLSQLKQELPHLSIIALLNKDRASYQNILNLINDKTLFCYLPTTNKVDQICQQISQAVELATKLYTGPLLLKWPPAEKFDIPEEKQGMELFTTKLNAIKSKVIGTALSGFNSLKKLWKKD